MVVLGQWPYQHTKTLNLFHVQRGIHEIYFADEDRIISYANALEMVGDDYTIDEELYTLMSTDLAMHMKIYNQQIFPAVMPPHVVPIYRKNINPVYQRHMEKVQGSAAALLVNGQSREIMEDIGAVWNEELDAWIVDMIQLKLLREKKKESMEGKIYGTPYLNDRVKIWGDITKHVQLLKDAGAVPDDKDEGIWYVKMSNYHMISRILSK